MTIITADYLLDKNFRLRKNWALRVDGDKISQIGPLNSISGPIDLNLGHAAIIPGLINCHNHLELTSLGSSVRRTSDFVAWLDEVRELRNSKSDVFLENSAREGISHSLESGVTTVVDHSNSGLSTKPLKEMPIRAFILFELIAIDNNTLKDRIPLFEKHIANTKEDKLIRWGLAPHASYSAGKELILWAIEKCRPHNRILSIHAHEHQEEKEFLETGAGSFRDMLLRIGVNVDEFDPPGMSPTKYLDELGFLRSGAILVHSNYISKEDMEIIRRANASIIFCPRSHHYFFRKNYPLHEMLSSGVKVAMGTDSMVSNWSLSILDEMRFVKKEFPSLKAATIFEMATSNGAAALGIESKIGKLAPEMQADIAALGKLPQKDNLNLEDLLQPEVENIYTMVAGKTIYLKTGE